MRRMLQVHRWLRVRAGRRASALAGAIRVGVGLRSCGNGLGVLGRLRSRGGSPAQGRTTAEAVFLLFPVPGVYEVRVVPFLVVNSGYSGSANLTFTPGPPTPNPTRPTGGIAVGPSIVADPLRTEGEPMI